LIAVDNIGVAMIFRQSENLNAADVCRFAKHGPISRHPLGTIKSLQVSSAVASGTSGPELVSATIGDGKRSDRTREVIGTRDNSKLPA
jgi:hypothetical protein